ncbi:glycosyltransferase [Palleronia sp. KMU-117]|uniref:glycosyltransferase n=1 Tax=Palleronia sp. KMU-117 TaxID=3434108 RepID=UPI003D75A53F
MPAPISAVIATRDAAQTLPGCAAALIEGLSEGLLRELVVSDGGSSDATLAIAAALGAVVVEGAGADREARLARGVAAARGAWLLILPPEIRLPPGWSALAEAHMAAAPGQAGYFARAGRGAVAALADRWPRRFVPSCADRALLLPRDGLPAPGRRVRAIPMRAA